VTAAQDFWALGDYASIAPRLQPAADELVAVANVTPGLRVLDVAAGTGNVAVAAAARGARVEACDLSPAMVAGGRTLTEGLDVRWQLGDAQALPFADRSMDAALSAFGVMFAHDPARAAAELFRVVRSGGTIALASWMPVGFFGASTELLSEFLPPPDGTHPLAWGEPAVAGARLAPDGSDLELQERELVWRFPSLEAAVAWFELGAPYVAARHANGADRYAELRARLKSVIERFCEPGAVALRPRYLIARVTRRRT
jgi:SAM-dependent methyltransferase